MLPSRRLSRTLFAPIIGSLTLGAMLIAQPMPASAQSTTPSDERAATKPFKPQLGQSGRDVIWLPTPNELITRLLEIAKVTPADTVVDLGSGDGKIVIAAARDFKANARGVEFDPRMVALSETRAQAAGVADRTAFVQADIFKHDFSDATVVAMYLLPELNLRLRPKLMAMQPGTRIVTHFFDMGRWAPDQTIEAAARPGYLWVVPANAGGEWTATVQTEGQPKKIDFTIRQTFQALEVGTNTGKDANPAVGKVDGTRVAFDLHADPSDSTPSRVEALLEGNHMKGTVTRQGKVTDFSAHRNGPAPQIDGAGAPTEDEMNAARLALGSE